MSVCPNVKKSQSRSPSVPCTLGGGKPEGNIQHVIAVF